MPETTCWKCGNDAETFPVCPDYIENPQKLICGVCWLARTDADSDVRFFLHTIDKQIPEVEKLVRTFHHTTHEWTAAVLSLRRLKDMRRFVRGCTLWHTGPGLNLEEAARITADNIGCVINEMGCWMRLKWWWATGITSSNIFHT